MKRALFFVAFTILNFTIDAIAQKKVSISGYIVDKASQETIIGATIIDQTSRQGTVSNAFGFYSITLPEGDAMLNFSYVGYEHQQHEIKLVRDTTINVSLNSVATINEVIVTATKKDAGLHSTGMGSMDVPVQMIEHTPTLLGETDLIRTIQLTPGVQQGIGGASSFFVRGGNGDENLILLDGSPIYKIDHLFGFFSVFTPEAIKKVTFYKSSFPARYNGRTSSVVDIRTKDGDMQSFHGCISVGLLTSRLNLEGPIVKDKTSFSISARTTYFSIVAKPFMSDNSQFSYWFYDINAKLNHKFSDNDRLYIGLYNGQDKMNSDYTENDVLTSQHYEQKTGTIITNNVDEYYGSNLKWGNTIATLRWNHIFSQRLFANTTLCYNHYRMKLSSYDDFASTNSEFYNKQSSSYHSEIIDKGGSIDFDYMPDPQHTIRFGISYLYHDFAPETSSSTINMKSDDSQPIDTAVSSTGKDIYAHEFSIYAEDDWLIGDRVHINPGFAFTTFGVQGKVYKNYQPRLSLRYAITDNWTAKAAYSQMAQCVHLLTSMPIAMPTDLWVPINKNLKPERAQQISIGAYYSGIERWEFSIEGYYKRSDNVIEYKDGMSFMGFSGSWTELVAMGQGFSKGIEFLARKTIGKQTGWLSYTLSKTDRKFSRNSGVNNGERFPFTYDRRHNINIVYSIRFNERVELDASWLFYSGACATITNSEQEYIKPDGTIGSAPYVPSRNNYRLPCSHLLNIGINLHKQRKHCERIWNFSIYNAYNQMNPAFIYPKTDDSYKTVENKLTKITILPIIPSATLTYKF
ncbi:MAG: TonB-dependent receptor [Bacteroidales bacterium]|nr:TonB-dependent receptor [Bacteroidales bacterium]